MRVIYIVTGLGMGGAERVVVNLADAIFERGHKVLIISLTGDVLVSPCHDDIDIISICMKGVSDILRTLASLRNIIRKFEPDVIHSHMFHANILARISRLINPVPILICSAHSNNEGGLLRMLAYRLTDRLANISTNVSEQAVNEFIARRAVKPGRMIVVHNGIDIERFKFNQESRNKVRTSFKVDRHHIILAVGRLDTAKDYPNLFNAISKLSILRQDFIVLIAGDGPLKSYLQQLSLSLNISDYVRLLGIRSDIPELMSASDVFVLSSAWEGFGLVIAEAMACERLVVATDCGGVKEVIGECGITVAIKSPADLAEALHSALEITPHDQKILCSKARERVTKKYSLEGNVDAYLKLYMMF